MREGKTRTQEQHAHVGAAITNAITHRMSACMPPKHLAALVPREEETHFSGDAFDTQRRGEKSSSGRPPVKMGIENQSSSLQWEAGANAAIPLLFNRK